MTRSTTKPPVTILWLRRDLRLADNAALSFAAARGAVLPVYVHAPDEDGGWGPGGASRWWLHHSLSALGEALQRRGLRLILRQGPTLPALQDLIRDSGASAVVWQRCYEPAAIARDTEIKSTLRAAGIVADSVGGALLTEPWQTLNQSGTPYQIFTSYWKSVRAKLTTAAPLATPPAIAAPAHWPNSLTVRQFELLPRVVWYEGLAKRWQPGEAGAQQRLYRFIAERLHGYDSGRDMPSQEFTSSLSPYLHFGEISPRQILHAIQAARPAGAWRDSKFVAELGWREFAHYLLLHFPHLPEQPLRAEFQRFPWRSAAAAPDLLRAWQRGRTGVPLVDAGMRELWATGYMHNRVRMVVASYLVKNLRIDWREGARWFWDTLVDADLANNTQGWQWSAGCGADAAPYFRIFSPDSQTERFDPQRVYIKRWIPEFGTSAYPPPIVDIKQSRAEALDAWRTMRDKPDRASR
jgi:deoxyribodipyrimidine photo-lyase